MTTNIELAVAFTARELLDIMNCAVERGMLPTQLIHDATVNDLAR